MITIKLKLCTYICGYTSEFWCSDTTNRQQRRYDVLNFYAKVGGQAVFRIRSVRQTARRLEADPEWHRRDQAGFDAQSRQVTEGHADRIPRLDAGTAASFLALVPAHEAQPAALHRARDALATPP